MTDLSVTQTGMTQPRARRRRIPSTIRATTAGYTVTWRYRSHRYMSMVGSMAAAIAMREAIRRGSTPDVVVAAGVLKTVMGGAGLPLHHGRAGGVARANRLTAVQRSAIARSGGIARWAYRTRPVDQKEP